MTLLPLSVWLMIHGGSSMDELLPAAKHVCYRSRLSEECVTHLCAGAGARQRLEQSQAKHAIPGWNCEVWGGQTAPAGALPLGQRWGLVGLVYGRVAG